MTVSLLLAAAMMASGPAAPASAERIDEVDVAYEELSQGRNEAAIEQMRSSELVAAGDPAALINLGTAYARMGKNEKARECFHAAMNADEHYMLELADGRWVDSRRAAKMAARNLSQAGAFASR